ncbi:MAG: type II secretion system secretin GspD [Nitrosomonadales bacterium]|nr:type II secretion system secretin GspD [Nitrosomonadales bacterium]
MSRMLLEWIARALCCMVLLLPAAATGAQDEKVSLNFVNADIEEVVRAVSHITGRNFLVDPRVKGTINIISSTPVSASLAYDILLSALRLQGFASVESGGVTKVMPEADAKLHVGAAGGARGAGDRLVTRVYVLKYESAAQLVPILRPLIAPNNIVVAYPNSNTLVVTDYAGNLKRIEQIVEAIDQPSAEAPVVIPLKHVSAVELAQTINRLMQDAAPGGAGGGGDASQRFVLAADSRTNSLLLRTDNPARIARVHDLAGKLDIETGAPGNVRVVYLKNAEATKMAQVLRAVMSGDTSAAGAAASAATQGAAPAAPSGGGMIQADTASNALIITAPSAIYNNLRAVVEMLDVRRAQVFVEALIVEVTADKAAEFGVQWQSLGGTAGTQAGGGTQVGAGTNFGGEGTNILSVAGSIAKGAPVIGAGLNIGVLRGHNLGLLARALESDANANILSTPNLLTLDNEEAKIIIGQNVPFITGSYAQTGNTATATPFQTIERKDVGLTLRIKPQISEGGTVKLQIYQEVSSVQDKTINNAAGVVTNKRSLESSVLVDEGQIIVLGGLIQDSVSNGEDKVPLLGDIPLLGNLFRHETRRHTKTNLMVFIRPYVLRAATDSHGLTQDRYEYLRGEQKNGQLPSRALLPDMAAPQLPELVLKRELSLPPSPAAPAGSAPGGAPPTAPESP